MPPPTQPQPVTRSSGRTSLAAQEQPVAGPSSLRLGASPMTGISFTNGGGFSFDKYASGGMGRSVRMSGGGGPGSYGARFYGGGFDSPTHPFSTSITMDGTSFTTSSAAFNLPPPLSTSSSFRGGRSYAAAAKGERDHPLSRGHPPNHNGHTGGNNTNPSNLSTSFASMSFQPMSFSFGTGSYSKSQVHSLMVNAGRPRTDAELTRTYECCGNTHHGLHDLLEHVEDAHPFTDPGDTLPGGMEGGGYQPSTTTGPGGRGTVQHIGFSPQVLAMDMDMDVAEAPNMGTIEERVSGGGSTRSSMSPISAPPVPSYPVPTSASSSKPSTPNETASSPAPLQISDVLTSPFANSPLTSGGPFTSSTQTNVKGSNNPTQPNSNASTSSSSPPEGSLRTPLTSAQPSPVFAVPKVGPTRGFLGSHPQSRLPQQRFDRAFNEVVAGSGSPKDKDPKAAPTAVAPGVLFGSAVAGLGIPTTPPVPGQKPEQPKENDGKVAQGDAQLPQPSLFTTHKPWRCPNPGCNKAYKQSNGLKYHQQKGQCDFAIHDAVDLGLSLEEAEERSRPFVCAVGAGCLKRYRQMNGLKYHYLNSGEHGQYGLRMLQNGTHPMPVGVPGTGTGSTTSNPGSTTSTPNTTPLKRPATTSTSTGAIGPSSTQNSNQATRTGSAPYHIPSQIGATRPRMGVFPTTTNNTNNNVNRPGGLAGIGRAGVPVRPGQGPLHTQNGLMQGQKSAPAPLPPIQRGRDAVLFAAVETMDL